MKKTTAVLAATAIGAVGSGFAAAPAQALPSAACTSYTEHEVTSSGTLDPDWYMDCVPQYGAGKVEFTVTADVDFPADYVRDFNDPAVTTTTTLDSAAATAYDFDPTPGAFQDLEIDDESNPDSTQYFGALVAPITGVESIDPTELPAACDNAAHSYPNAYKVSFGAVSTTFTQEAGGEPWTSTVDLTPEALFLGFTPNAVDGSVSGANGEWVCAAGASHATAAPAQSLDGAIAVIEQFITNSDFQSKLSLGPARDGFSGAYNLGTFAAAHGLEPVAEEIEPEPELEDTAVVADAEQVLPDVGGDVDPLLLLAGVGSLVAGGALVRRGSPRPAKQRR